ncbi:MAG TPA: methylamine utilization protein [Gammaproteobacteria bacterium]|jgi:plastocyanin
MSKALLGLLLGFACAAQAADLTVSVTDTHGKPVAQAVISLEPVSGSTLAAPEDTRAIMDQRDREFVPHVLAVQVGTDVTFPNSDDIHHDVYSFSPAKTFELPLYKGVPAKPVRFDKPGVVVLGCNIHDWMLGYIDVVPTPWFGMTGVDGRLTLHAPAGSYRLALWQPDMDTPDHRQNEQLDLPAQGAQRDFHVPLKPSLVRKQHPVDSLEDKFKRLQDAKTPPLPD